VGSDSVAFPGTLAGHWNGKVWKTQAAQVPDAYAAQITEPWTFCSDGAVLFMVMLQPKAPWSIDPPTWTSGPWAGRVQR
jgi:hypothetical protein